jgi:UDP-2,3-diacylglucosamine hydrolase
MIFFISDLHLGLEERSKERQKEDLLIRFLEKIKKDCEVLYLAGDVFDFWFEYRTVLPRPFYRVLAALDDFAGSGNKVEYLMGNHDFGHNGFFENELGIQVHREDITREHNGKKFYIAHGDGKAKNDLGYKILKKILRSPVSLWFYLKLHPNLGIKLASGSSQQSRHYTSSKDFGKLDGLQEFASKKISEGFDYVVMGHRHKAEKTRFGNGYYINLGEWINHPKAGIFDGNEFRLVDMEEFLS